MRIPWLDQLRQLGVRPGAKADDETADNIRRASLSVAPVVWLLGNTGSGKTSIIASLTGASNADIGNGYAACTKTAMVYDFPADQPLIRFLDTRGLGEVGYDPGEDMSVNAERAHLVIATMRAADMSQGALVDALQRIRDAHRRWPIVVAQTCLHELYDSKKGDHPAQYAFGGDPDNDWRGVPRRLRAALQRQRSMLDSLKGEPPIFVPVDFTRKRDGFTQTDYGRDALIEAVLEVAPRAMKDLAQLHFRQERRGAIEKLNARANRTALYYAAAAAGAGAIPVVGTFTVPTVNATMLWALARLYEVVWDRKSVASLLSMLGFATAVREGVLFGLRQVLKVIPWLIPVAAVQDYAATYALGRAASVFMAARKANVEADAEEVRKVFYDSLKEAFRMGRRLSTS